MKALKKINYVVILSILNVSSPVFAGHNSFNDSSASATYQGHKAKVPPTFGNIENEIASQGNDSNFDEKVAIIEREDGSKKIVVTRVNLITGSINIASTEGNPDGGFSISEIVISQGGVSSRGVTVFNAEGQEIGFFYK